MADETSLILWQDTTPVLSPQERLTRQFYVWEQRGRGWQVWPYPVTLEPPFRPFLFHFLPPRQQPVDDGKRHTFLSALVDRFKGTRTQAQPLPPWDYLPDDDEIIEAEAEAWSDEDKLIEIHVALPPKVTIAKETAEHFLLSLSYCEKPVSFEVIGTCESIIIQLACFEQDKFQVWQQLQAHFPDSVLTEETGFLETTWNQNGSAYSESLVVDLGLSNEFMLPLRAVKGFEVDPLIGIIGALASLAPGEVCLLQILFQATRFPWTESAVRAVSNYDGSSFFADFPELDTQSRQKLARPLFACIVRLAVQSGSHARCWQIARAFGGALTQFGNPAGNELIALANDDYPDIDHEIDVLARSTHRSGMLLNSDELVSLVHLPSSSVRTEKLKRQAKKTHAAPSIANGRSLSLGENRHGGQVRQVGLSLEQRTRHIYTIGASGTGKSTLLLNLIRQDIENGHGVAVLDPHGDLIDTILGLIPEQRFDDVILFDPSDSEFPIGFNILSAHSELEKTLLESDLVGVFRRLSTSWGDQMNSVLSNAILAFLESALGGTLQDMRRFLIEPDFRQRFLQTVTDPDVVYYWQREFPLLTGRPQAPLLTRLDTFLRPKPIRYMVAQKENKIDFGKVMNEGKIFLAKLSQGAIGEENSYLLGSLLVSKFHQMALSRQEMAQAQRKHFWLYIDEFQNFVTPSMASILSGARKYRLGLVLAHQELRQLLSKDIEVASAVLTNPGARICFRVGDDDARKLADGFAHFDATDLQSLGIGEAICRMERSDYDFNLHTQILPEIDEDEATERRAEIQTRSRQKYARLRLEIEAELAKQQPQTPPPAKADRLKAKGVREQTDEVVPYQEPPSSSLPVPAPLEELSQVKLEAAVQAMAEPQQQPSVSKAKSIASETPPGKGGQQHKYLQQLIKRWGEERGYKATIEKQVKGGGVDVALESGKQTIACEISVTTTVDHEVSNIRKCLDAGFTHVIMVTSEAKGLGKIKDAAFAQLGSERLSAVHFFLPEDLFLFLDQNAAEGRSKEETIKGYKVKVKYKPLTQEEQKVRKEAVAKTVLQAMKRLKGKVKEL